MVITYSVILIGLLFLIRPLQKNSFYILHAALIILAAYYIETHYFRASVFGAKTLLLFVVFQFVSINVVTVLAYWVDKRAAVRGAWRVPEINLHTLEFLGGWSGALLAQRLFRHIWDCFSLNLHNPGFVFMIPLFLQTNWKKIWQKMN